MSIGDHFAADAARDAVDRLSDERDQALALVAKRDEALILYCVENTRLHTENDRLKAEIEAGLQTEKSSYAAARRVIADLTATIERVRALLPGRGHSRADRGPYRAVDSDMLRAALDHRTTTKETQ